MTPPSRNQFLELLVDSRLLSPERLEGYLADLAAEEGAGGVEGIARCMVRDGLLTRYQAQSVYQGRAKHLILGDYLLLDFLGSGGMGHVFRAHHRPMDRIVAVKVLASRLSRDHRSLERFRREAIVGASLEHPHITTIYDLCECEGRHFLVMEYVDGADLACIVKKSGPLTVAVVLACVRQVAEGLAHAHDQGIVHRDIKPHNLLLDRQHQVKILDMGLARLKGEFADSLQSLTRGEELLGTPSFMAPEQARDGRAADARSDIYSLGCTVFYLLTGRPPYDGDSPVKILLAHQAEAVPELERAREGVPSALGAVCRKMMAKRPEDRFASVRELLDDWRQLEAAFGAGESPAMAGVRLPGGATECSNRGDAGGDSVRWLTESLQSLPTVFRVGHRLSNVPRSWPAWSGVGVVCLLALGAWIWTIGSSSPSRTLKDEASPLGAMATGKTEPSARSPGDSATDPAGVAVEAPAMVPEATSDKGAELVFAFAAPMDMESFALGAVSMLHGPDLAQPDSRPLLTDYRWRDPRTLVVQLAPKAPAGAYRGTLDDSLRLRSGPALAAGTQATAVVPPDPRRLQPALLGQFYELPETTEVGAFPRLGQCRLFFVRKSERVEFSDDALRGPLGHPGLPARFAVHWSGWIKINSAGVTRFWTAGNGASRLFIDGQLVVHHDGRRTDGEAVGSVQLIAGYHYLELEYFCVGDRSAITLFLQAAGSVRAVVPPDILYHDYQSTNSRELLVRTTADEGPGSLREALAKSNYACHDLTIRFSIPTSDSGFIDVDTSLPGGDAEPDVYQINVLSPLPPLGNAEVEVELDGTTQTASGGDTNPSGPEIVLAGQNVPGLTVSSNGHVVTGLVLHGFAQEAIGIWNASDIVVSGNYIGIDATGTNGLENSGAGVRLAGSQRITVGGFKPEDGNVISGCGREGVVAEGFASQCNIVGNRIGTDRNGAVAIGNSLDGVKLGPYAFENRVGGTEPGARNLISGNGRTPDSAGVRVCRSHGNAIVGNWLGLDATGSRELPNEIGICVVSDAYGNRIEGNVISGNGRLGVLLDNVCANQVIGNRIGMAADGASALVNRGQAVRIGNPVALANIIGGSETSHQNIIATASDCAVGVMGRYNVVENNLVQCLTGADPATKRVGITLFPSACNSQVAGNQIVGDAEEGIRVEIARPDTIPADRLRLWLSAEGGNDHYYLIIPDERSWLYHAHLSNRFGGTLVTVASAEEQAFLEQNVLVDNQPSRVWMGGWAPQRNHEFGWVTGEPFDFTRWGSQQPRGAGEPAYVWMECQGVAEWGAAGCEANYAAIYEFESNPIASINNCATNIRGNRIGIREDGTPEGRVVTGIRVLGPTASVTVTGNQVRAATAVDPAELVGSD